MECSVRTSILFYVWKVSHSKCWWHFFNTSIRSQFFNTSNTATDIYLLLHIFNDLGKSFPFSWGQKLYPFIIFDLFLLLEFSTFQFWRLLPTPPWPWELECSVMTSTETETGPVGASGWNHCEIVATFISAGLDWNTNSWLAASQSSGE